MKRKPKQPVKHVAAIARDLWAAQKPEAFDPKTLGTEHPGYYLKNRLELAFADGWDAAERHYGHIIERMRHRP